MLPNGTDRVLAVSDANTKCARDRTSCVDYTAMSFRTTAFRASIFFGLATLVAAILWFTPPPCKYRSSHLRGPGLTFYLTDIIAVMLEL
jgi:hypothetical protein